MPHLRKLLMKKTLLLVSWLFIISWGNIEAVGEEVASGKNKERPYQVFVLKSPITDEKLLATDTLEKVEGSSNVERSNQLSLVACPGEYEPASFVIYAQQDLNQVNISASDLKNKGEVIPSKAIDVRVVKCWYQGGPGLGYDGKKYLTPELLLKNDDLIQVDYTSEANSPIDYKTIKDAEKLQSFDIPAKSLKQIWVTVHVPEGISPENYEGTIDVLPSNGVSTQVNLIVKVLPFKLEEPRLEYCIYYHGQLTEQRTLGPFHKSAVQMLADFKYMKTHGIDNPWIGSSSTNFQPVVLKQVLELRQQAGIDNKTILYGGDPETITLSFPTDPKGLQELKRLTRERIKFFKENGVSEVYFYGADEATGEKLKAQRPAWEAIHEVGGKLFVACSAGFSEIVGDLLDLPIYAFASYPDPYLPGKVHTYPGHKLYCYGAWSGQLGVEVPYTVRAAYGFNLWKAGYDGVCEYAYQHPVPWGNSFDEKDITLWDDFDTVPPGYRDFVMAYTTIDGVVPTIHGEGFREGVDDVRYITTLEKMLKATRRIPSLNTYVQETERWLKNLDVKGESLPDIRREIVERIMKLKTLASNLPPVDSPLVALNVVANEEETPAGQVIDGITESLEHPAGWRSGYPDKGPDWIYIDLGKNVLIDKVVVYHQELPNGGGVASAYTISTSVDGIDPEDLATDGPWTTQVAVTGNSEMVVSSEFKEALARYVRISGLRYFYGQSALAEIKVYGREYIGKPPRVPRIAIVAQNAVANEEPGTAKAVHVIDRITEDLGSPYGWISAYPSKGSDWIYIDLGKNRLIDKVIVYHQEDDWLICDAYTISTAVDGVSAEALATDKPWTTQRVVTGNSEMAVSSEFKERLARYVRVSGMDYGHGQSALAEIEVYGARYQGSSK
jgi:hypothetical protein